MSMAWSAVRIAVPSKRSCTTLWSRARATISATSLAISWSSSAVGPVEETRPAGEDRPPEQPVAGGAGVEAQQPLPDP